MFLIVGLGNPGSRYACTRHNVGFMVIDHLAGTHGIECNRVGFSALWGEGTIAGKRVLLFKPQTFMNLSGRAVCEIAHEFGIPPCSMVVVYDDCDLPFGRIRIRRRGGSGGHRGVESIIDFLGTEDFPRVRIGIGRPVGGDITEYVLSPFEPEEQKTLKDILERIDRAIEVVVAEGVECAMNRFNESKG